MMADTHVERTPAVGVILAGGKGTRLMPLSAHCPKPLLPVVDRPLIEHQLATLRSIGITDVFVVIGHLGAEIVRHLGDGRALGVSIRYVEQPNTLGIAHALSLVEPMVNGPMLVVLGDVFFEHRDLADMIAMTDGGVDGVLAVKDESSLEAIRKNFVVLEDETGRVKRVVEKPRHPRGRLKGCGIYLFRPEFFDSLRRTPRSSMRDEYELTDSIQIFIDDGYDVRAARVIREDVNLSYAADLLDLNLRLIGEQSRVAPDARVAPGATIRRSVLMPGAVVEHPIVVSDSLIFPDARLRATTDVHRHIVTADDLVYCP